MLKTPITEGISVNAAVYCKALIKTGINILKTMNFIQFGNIVVSRLCLKA